MPDRMQKFTPRAPMNEPAVRKYLDHMETRKLRHWTIYGRERVLARLSLWAESPVLKLTEQQLKDYVAMKAKTINPEPLRTEISHFRQFYRWALREGLIKVDPTLRIDLPRVSRGLPRPISEKDLAFAFASTSDAKTRVIMALAAFAGLRAAEIAGLDWREVTLDGEYPNIRVENGKGGHVRVVPLSDVLIEYLREIPQRKGPVISAAVERPMGPRAYRRGSAGHYANHVGKRANEHLHGVGIEATLHQLRHRFATVTYQACQDIRAVQDLMGHASPVTTARYAAGSVTVGRDAVQAAGKIGGVA